VKKTVLTLIIIISAAICPAFAKYDHALVDMYLIGQKTPNTDKAGFGASYAPIHFGRTDQSLFYLFGKFDYTISHTYNNDPEFVPGTRGTSTLLFGIEYQRRFGESNWFIMGSFALGGTYMYIQDPHHFTPFKDNKEIKTSVNFGPAAEFSIGGMWAPFKQWGFFLNTGWRQPYLIYRKDQRYSSPSKIMKHGEGGPFVSIGARALVPGWGM
jgi:hypothetical protein